MNEQLNIYKHILQNYVGRSHKIHPCNWSSFTFFPMLLFLSFGECRTRTSTFVFLFRHKSKFKWKHTHTWRYTFGGCTFKMPFPAYRWHCCMCANANLSMCLCIFYLIVVSQIKMKNLQNYFSNLVEEKLKFYTFAIVLFLCSIRMLCWCLLYLCSCALCLTYTPRANL